MTMTGAEPAGTGSHGARLSDAGFPAERISLVDLLDRVLAGGVVVTGEITLSIADVDLVVISLRALLTSVGALAGPATGPGAGPGAGPGKEPGTGGDDERDGPGGPGGPAAAVPAGRR
jgi:hypothetical protein